MHESKERFIISVGGSLIVPPGGIDTAFLSSFGELIREQLAAHPQRQFFLVTGGGYTAREYQQAGQEVVGHELPADDLDWLGIHSTRLNAHLVRTIFRDIAYPRIIKDFNVIQKISEPVVVAAGWKPGWSTDYIAVLLAEDYKVATVINLSNITQVYDKDPKLAKDAKPLDHLDWETYRGMVGEVWTPGLSTPFDPIAAKKAAELHTKVVVMNGSIENLQNYLEGAKFTGTVLASAQQVAR
ncbi:MAG TPA: UMP kinase [Candidatus Saccharimonadales bacterium]|nr:UMP kinase [Candidatus Saccharimonadales bacterium]